VGSEARARVGLIALLVGTLAAFEHLFGSGDYWAPALLGSALALGAAIAGRRLGLSTPLVVLASSVLAAWYLLVVFEGSATYYGLPTLKALQRLGDDLMSAYDLSMVDYAPVPVRTGYAAFSVAIMWLIATVGEIATFRWKRPLLASVIPMTLFTFLMIVGDSPLGTWLVLLFLVCLFTYWGLESTHRLRSWGRWVTAWREDDDEPTTLVGDLARRMGVVCVLAALVVPLFLPALEEGFLAWRNQAGQGPGGGGGGDGSGSGIVDPLVSVVPDLIRQSESEMFRVETDLAPDAPRPYWRMQSLVRFDGETWYPDTEAELPVQFGPGDDGLFSATSVPRNPDLPLPTVAAEVNQRFTVLGLRNEHMPLAGIPFKIDVASDDAAGNVTVNPIQGDLRLSTGLQGGFFYEVAATVSQPSFRQLKRSDIPVEPPGSRWAQLPPGMNREIGALALEWTRGEATDLEKLVAIQNQLRNPLVFEYDTQIGISESDDYLSQFLFETRKGYCQQFATAFAVLARSLGYATRVVVGFLPGESQQATPDRFVVKGSDAHAWPEVYFPGHGWIPFEPTPRGGATGPAHTVPPTQLPTGGLDPNIPTNLGPQAIGEGNRRPEVFRGSDDPRRIGVEAGARIGREAEAARRWREGFMRVVIVLAIALFLFLASVPLLKQARSARPYRRAQDARARAAAGFVEFQHEAAEFTRSRGAAESANSFARRVAAARGLPLDEAVRLASIYDAANYAPAEVDLSRVEEARDLAKGLRARLWTSSTPWEKTLRLFRPNGLLGRT